MLIAEELAVLLTKERGGWRCTGQDVADTLAGGLLAELVLEGYVDREVDPADIWARRRVRHDSVEPPSDPLLAAVWQLITKDQGSGAVHRRVAKVARDLVLPRLVEAEVLSATPRPLVGPRYSLLDEDLRERLRAPLVAVVEGAQAESRSRTQLWLLRGANCARQALGLELGRMLDVSRGLSTLGKPSWAEKTAINAMEGRRAAIA